MLRCCRWVAQCLLSAPAVLHSQATVIGRVREVGTAAPLAGVVVLRVPRGEAAVSLAPVETDREGRFEIPRPVEGRLWLHLICPRPTTLMREITSREVSADGGDAAIAIDVPVGYCAPERYRERAVVVRGWYRSAFEVSWFHACEGEAVPVSLQYWARDPAQIQGTPAWVALAPGARAALRAGQPPETSAGTDTWFVRWSGQLRGPGQYGHGSVNLYELAVDSVWESRTPGAGDCGEDRS